ncbi:hypothetical protein AgCh_019318 [Apium graveolens]
MEVADKKKLLWKNVKPSDPKKSQLLSTFMTIGLNAREPKDRVGLGSDEAKIKTGVEVATRDPFLLTDRPLEDVTQKHLDKVISAQVVLDVHDKHNVKENLILFLEDGRKYQMSESDVLNKSLKELQFFHYLLEVKSDITMRCEIPMKKDFVMLEVILNEKCLCYNEDSSNPRLIRLNDGLERNHISALRTAIYQIGSQNEEMKQVKTTLSQVLRNKEEKLISSFVNNHFGFILTRPDIEEINTTTDVTKSIHPIEPFSPEMQELTNNTENEFSKIPDYASPPTGKSSNWSRGRKNKTTMKCEMEENVHVIKIKKS